VWVAEFRASAATTHLQATRMSLPWLRMMVDQLNEELVREKSRTSAR
jgi:hypothetical protein